LPTCEVARTRKWVTDRRDIGADVDGDDVRTLRGELDRVASALATTCAGDEGNLSIDTTRHAVRLPFSICCRYDNRTNNVEPCAGSVRSMPRRRPHARFTPGTVARARAAMVATTHVVAMR